MTPVTAFAGRNVAVFGLGGSGLATAHALQAGGCTVAAWDDSDVSRARGIADGLELTDLREADFAVFDALVLAPGAPLTHPAPHWTVTKAKEAGIAVIGDIELFCHERRLIAPGSPMVAITGSNGKSTTTALIAHLLRHAGRDVQMGGNIGVAVLSLEPPAASRVHVIECSSFQIDLAPTLDPGIGILLNVSPDHLDRHGDMARYAAIKERLVAGSGLAIIGVEDDWCRAAADCRAAAGLPLVRITTEGSLADGTVADGSRILRMTAGEGRPVADLAGIAALRGAHNAQNACAAIAALSALGVDDSTIARGLAAFPGLAHRMEPVGHVGRVGFVNDSKATNADSAEVALKSFASDVFWIVGGKAKDGGIDALAPLFGRVAKAYLVGASSAAFARTLEGRAAFEACGDIETAVVRAAADAAASGAAAPVVLLSPACASYDQFPNFEVRGNRFRACVSALPGFVASREG